MAKHRRLSESSTPRGSSADASVPDPTRVVACSAGCVPARVSPVAHVRVVRPAGHRANHTDHASHRGRHARRGWDGRGGVVPRGMPVLLPPRLGHRPNRADAGPADRVPVARRRRGDRGGGRRHAVSPVGAEGVRRVLDPRRLRAGPQRARPRQPVDHHRDRRHGTVLLTPGVSAGAVAGCGAARAPPPRCSWQGN